MSQVPSHPSQAKKIPTTPIRSSTLGTMNLFFQRPSVYTGTPAYLNNTYLNFDISGTPYAMDFVSVGDDHGYSVPVTAVFSATQENGRAGFSVSSDGEVQATLTAATQGFFACKRTLEDAGPVEMEGLTLDWGIFQEDGSAPEGCVFAGLKTAMVPD